MSHKQVWPCLVGICGRGRSCCAAPVVSTVSGNHGRKRGRKEPEFCSSPARSQENPVWSAQTFLHQITQGKTPQKSPTLFPHWDFSPITSQPSHCQHSTLAPVPHSGDRMLWHLCSSFPEIPSDTTSPSITSQLPEVTVLISVKNPGFLMAPAPPNSATSFLS